MARHHAPLLTSIWDDDDFRQLSPLAQRLYMQILSQKRLTLVGVIPYMPRNLARGCAGLTVDDIERDVAELVDRRYVVIDHDTQELLVRTILKHDPPRGAKTLKGMWNQWGEVDSQTLRELVLEFVPPEAWSDDVNPPEEAKDLRNTPSDTPFHELNQNDFKNRSATFHLPPSTGRASTTGTSSYQSHQGAVDNSGIETTIANLSERFRA